MWRMHATTPYARLFDMGGGQACGDLLEGWNQVGFDPIASSGGYGTFAAVLAGFAISGLLWIVASKKANQSNDSVIMLWASILPLSLATLFEAELGGELNCERAVIERAFASLLLTIGAATLFLALSELLAPHLDDPKATKFAWLFSWAVLGIATSAILAGNMTLIRTMDRDAPLSIAIGYAAILLVGLAMAAFRRAQIPYLSGAGVIVLLSIIVFVGFYLTGFFNPPEWAPELVAWGRVLCWVPFIIGMTRREAFPER